MANCISPYNKWMCIVHISNIPTKKGWNYKFKKEEIKFWNSWALFIMQYFSNMANCISPYIYQISQRKGGDIINSRRSRQSNIRHSQELPAFHAFSSTHINLSQLSKICSANCRGSWGILMSNISPFFTPAQLKTMKAWGDLRESTHLNTITMISWLSSYDHSTFIWHSSVCVRLYFCKN